MSPALIFLCPIQPLLSFLFRSCPCSSYFFTLFSPSLFLIIPLPIFTPLLLLSRIYISSFSITSFSPSHSSFSFLFFFTALQSPLLLRPPFSFRSSFYISSPYPYYYIYLQSRNIFLLKLNLVTQFLDPYFFCTQILIFLIFFFFFNSQLVFRRRKASRTNSRVNESQSRVTSICPCRYFDFFVMCCSDGYKNGVGAFYLSTAKAE